MIRVLHLLPADGDLQYRRSFAALRDSPASCEFTIRTIGRGGDYSNLFWAVIGLRRIVGQFDVVQTWDERGLTAATMGGAEKIVFTAPPSLSRRGPGLVRRAASRAELHVVTASLAQLQYFISRGLPAEHCHLIHPPAEPADTSEPCRRSMRKLLGIRDDDFVILAPGESMRAAGHDRAVWIGSILHVVDERYRVLLWGRGNRIESAAGLGQKLRQPGLVIVAERKLKRCVEFDDLLCAADTMLVSSRSAIPTLSIGLAMKSRLPVVSATNLHLAELLRDGVTALTVPTDAPRPMAQRILDLRADSQQRSAIIANANHLADDLFDPARFVEQYQAAYACGTQVQLA